jgi:hypothetical protein
MAGRPSVLLTAVPAPTTPSTHETTHEPSLPGLRLQSTRGSRSVGAVAGSRAACSSDAPTALRRTLSGHDDGPSDPLGALTVKKRQTVFSCVSATRQTSSSIGLGEHSHSRPWVRRLILPRQSRAASSGRVAPERTRPTCLSPCRRSWRGSGSSWFAA